MWLPAAVLLTSFCPKLAITANQHVPMTMTRTNSPAWQERCAERSRRARVWASVVAFALFANLAVAIWQEPALFPEANGWMQEALAKGESLLQKSDRASAFLAAWSGSMTSMSEDGPDPVTRLLLKLRQ